MAINRAPFNALVDDDGSGNVGTVWNKNQIKSVLLDPIDAMFALGTWTPTDASGAGLALSGAAGTWISLGTGVIYVNGHVTYPTTSNGSAAKLGGLPFPVASAQGSDGALTLGYTTLGSFMSLVCQGGTSNIELYDTSGSAKTNAQLSGKYVSFAGIYRG